MSKKSLFLRGLRDGLPICFGYLSVSFAFGIATVSSGLPILQTLLISMTCVTSAGQMAAVPIMLSGGTLIEMAVSQLIINLRYALMSLSVSQKMDGSMNVWRRALFAFVNTDEVFAVASAQAGPLGHAYLFGLILMPYVGWSVGTLAGAVLGDVLPPVLTVSLGIAIYGMFIAIVVPAARDDGRVALCALTAVLLSCLFRYLPFLSNVPGGFVIILCAVIAAGLFAFVLPLPDDPEVD